MNSSEARPPDHKRAWEAVVRAWWVVLVALIVLLAIMPFFPPQTAGGVDVSSEKFALVASRNLLWPVGGFELFGCLPGDAAPKLHELDDSDSLVIETGSHVEATQPEDGEGLHINIEPESGGTDAQGGCRGQSGVRLNSGHREIPLRGTGVSLQRRARTDSLGAPVQRNTLLELEGSLTVGQDFRVGADEMLLSGKISLYATPSASVGRFLLKPSYVADELQLQRGDKIEPQPLSKQDNASGFVRIPATGPMQLDYFVPAKSITVDRVERMTITLSLSSWSRFRNEPLLQVLVWVIALLLGALEFKLKVHDLNDRLGGK